MNPAIFKKVRRFTGLTLAVALFAYLLSPAFAVTLTSVSIQSNNASGSLAKVGDVVTLSFSGDQALSGVTATIGGGSAASAGSGGLWTATRTLDGTETGGILPFSVDYSDTLGSTGTTVTATTDGSSVNFFKTPPTMTFAYSSTGETNSGITVTGSSNVPVTLVSSGGFSAIDPSTFVRTFSENGSGTVTFADAAGNSGSATATVNTITATGAQSSTGSTST